MTAITKKELSRIQSEITFMQTKIVNHAFMPIDNFVRLFWTDEEHEAVNYAYVLMGVSKLENFSVRVPDIDMELPEDMPVPEIRRTFPIDSGEERPIKVRVTAYAIKKFPVPHRVTIRPDAPVEVVEEFKSATKTIIEGAAHRGMWGHLYSLYGRCTSHEAMRYLFPGIVTVLRQAELHDIANKVETVSRRPTHLPDLTPYDRLRLKYLNQWFAMQALLGTFEAETKPIKIPANHVILRLSDMFFLTSDETDMPFKLET